MKTIKTIILLAALLVAAQVSAAEFVSGKIIMATPDGEMGFELPPSGFEVADYTSMGQASSLVVKSFETMITGDVSNVTLAVAMYKQGQSAQAENWMDFPLTKGSNGIWSIELNQDLVEVAGGAGEYVLELYAKADDGGTQLLLNNGGENYKVMFALGNGENAVHWLTTGTATITLYTGDYMEYRYNGDGTRDNTTMPGGVNQLAVNYFSIYYDLAEGTNITSASLQYMIYPEGENGGNWNTIECNELNTLVSARKNTHRSSCNEQRLITRDLAPGNYVLRIMYQLIDDNGHYYFFGKDGDRYNDNCVFYFSINEPADPDIQGLSMLVTLTPGEQQDLWLEAGNAFEPVDLTGGEALTSLTIDEAFIFAEGNFSTLGLGCKVCDVNGNDIYGKFISTQLDDYGNWSTEEPTELLDATMLKNGQVYNLYFWVEGEAGGQQYYLNNDGENYRVTFAFGSGAEVTRGDLNCDNIVDVDDLNLIINMMLSKTEKTAAADINNDGNVDVDDMNIVINIMLGKD